MPTPASRPDMHWRDHLQARLLEIRPASVCVLDEAARHMVHSLLPATPIRMHPADPGAPCSLALGIDALNGLSAQHARQLISQTRLFLAPRMLLVAQSESALDAPMFRALGFNLSATDATDGTRIHEYDLDTYKTVPDWLNARYWAHPERWEP